MTTIHYMMMMIMIMMIIIITHIISGLDDPVR